jgi:hypothetical protein
MLPQQPQCENGASDKFWHASQADCTHPPTYVCPLSFLLCSSESSNTPTTATGDPEYTHITRGMRLEVSRHSSQSQMLLLCAAAQCLDCLCCAAPHHYLVCLPELDFVQPIYNGRSSNGGLPGGPRRALSRMDERDDLNEMQPSYGKADALFPAMGPSGTSTCVSEQLFSAASGHADEHTDNQTVATQQQHRKVHQTTDPSTD